MCARTQTFSPAGKGTCRTPWWRGRGSKPDALGVLTGQWGSAEVPLSLWGSRGRPMAKWVRQSHRTIELFKLEKTFKIPKPTSHHACCPCPSLPHLCSPKHLQGRGLPHPEQPWQPIPVPDTSQTALWGCTELLGCLIWGTAPEDKHWVKTYIISDLKIYTFFFLNFRQLSHCLSRNFYPKPEITAIKGKDEKWGEEKSTSPPTPPCTVWSCLLQAMCSAATGCAVVRAALRSSSWQASLVQVNPAGYHL